jgi:hypothetical protein
MTAFTLFNYFLIFSLGFSLIIKLQSTSAKISFYTFIITNKLKIIKWLIMPAILYIFLIIASV